MRGRMPHWRDIDDMPTLCVSQTCDLKIDTGDARLWQARTTLEDGEPFRNTIYVELEDNGRWIDAGYYDGDNPPDGGAGWTWHMFSGWTGGDAA